MILKLIKFCSERVNNVTIRFILLFGKYIFYIFFVLPEFLLRALVCVSQFHKIRSGNCIIVQRRNAFPHTVRKKVITRFSVELSSYVCNDDYAVYLPPV